MSRLRALSLLFALVVLSPGCAAVPWGVPSAMDSIRIGDFNIRGSSSGGGGESLDATLTIGATTAQAITASGSNVFAGANTLGATTVLTQIAGTLNVDEAATFDTTLGVTGVLTAANANVFGASGVTTTFTAAATDGTILDGAFAGLSFSAPTLLVTSNAAAATWTEHATAPGTPGAASSALYVKADGLFYSKDDAGTETLEIGRAHV